MSRRLRLPVFVLALDACGGNPQRQATNDVPPVQETPQEQATVPTMPPPVLQPKLSVVAKEAAKGDVVALIGGANLICGLRKDADMACFGSGFPEGWSDFPSFDTRSMSLRPFALQGVRAESMSADDFGRCLVFEDGRLECWGAGMERGRTFLRLESPPAASRARSVSVGGGTCVVDDRGDVICWGSEPCRPKGVASSEWAETRRVAGGATAVGVSYSLACFLSKEGTVTCWGHADGDGYCRGIDVVPVHGLDRAVEIAVGHGAACALTEDGQVKCWGARESELLGVSLPGTAFVEKPVTVEAVAPAVKLHGSDQTMCALKSNGDVWCWGRDVLEPEADQVATRFESLSPAIDVVAADDWACALLTTREVRCFPEWHPPGPKKPHPYESREAWINAPIFKIGAKPPED